MAPMIALKAASPFLGSAKAFRASCRGQQAPVRMKVISPQAFQITLKTPDGEQKIECAGESANYSLSAVYQTARALEPELGDTSVPWGKR